jgi:predicted dinucleotide-binding enzyme
MSQAHVAVLGHGRVGTAMARALRAAGREVVVGADAPRLDRALDVLSRDPGLAGVAARPASEAVDGADMVLLAIPTGALPSALAPLERLLAGRTIIDATNPVGPGFTHALARGSGAEQVAAIVPEAHVVKAFNIYGVENLAGVPTSPGTTSPLMPYAGDDATAKARVAQLAADLGWAPLDVGPLSAAVDLEHLALLWIRLVRSGGHDPHLVWTARQWAG